MMCDKCEGTGCPYCAGPEADYHTWCATCEDCGGSGVIVSWKDKFATGFVQGSVLGAFTGIFGGMWD